MPDLHSPDVFLLRLCTESLEFQNVFLIIATILFATFVFLAMCSRYCNLESRITPRSFSDSTLLSCFPPFKV